MKVKTKTILLSIGIGAGVFSLVAGTVLHLGTIGKPKELGNWNLKQDPNLWF